MAASKCITRAIAAATAWRTVATAILVTETALLAARLSMACALTAAMPTKTLAAANPRSVAQGAVCLAMPLAVAFLSPGMVVTAIRRAVMETGIASLSCAS